MRGIESAAARQAIAEARQRWLPILKACVARNEDGVDEHVHTEIRRLQRLLGLPPADPSPAVLERRRQQVRDRVRRFRERRASEAAMPQVLNYKHGVRPGLNCVYIGRPMPRYGLRGSKWQNPFKIPRDGDRDQVVGLYEAWVLEQPELVAALPELRGKDLLCWCAPERCHGEVLLRLAND